jgi:hypothetical protein
VHVPLGVSVVIVPVLALVVAVISHRVGAPPAEAPVGPERAPLVRLGLPVLIAALIGAISLLPIFRAGFATVPGQNGDAILAVGSAVLLEHAPPTATRPALPIDHIPLEWRSKYPIYYALAGVSKLAGQDPIRTFAPVVALMLAMTAIGFFLFARHVIRAGPWASLLAAMLVPLDRIVMYVAIHPYFNQLWGQFTLPFTFLFGLRFLRQPDRRSALLFGLFFALGVFAYPLMLPFPLIFLGGFAWLEWRRRRAAGEPAGWIRALRIPRPHARPWMWIPAVLIGIPVVAVLLRGVLEKVNSSFQVIAPWTSLSGWSGGSLPFLPWPRFFGIGGNPWPAAIGLVAVWLLAWRARRRLPEDVRRPLTWVLVAGVLIGIYFHARSGGQLFFFKVLGFTGPLVLMVALLEVVALLKSNTQRAATAGIALLIAALLIVPAGARREIGNTFDNATPAILDLRNWDHRLPAGASVRIDVPPSGIQLWSAYMLADHPVETLHPLTGFFPHPPRGRKADYVMVQLGLSRGRSRRPADAIGPALMRNAQFELWRMNPAVPGPDRSSRKLVDDVKKITLAGGS